MLQGERSVNQSSDNVGRGGRSLVSVAKKYEMIQSMNKAERVAHFMEYMAIHCPYEVIPASVVAEAIFQTRSEKALVKIVNGARGRARVILRDTYKRSLHVVPGEGMRATVDDKDVAETTVPKAARRFTGARASLEAEVNVVDDVNALPDEARKLVKTTAALLKASSPAMETLKGLLTAKSEDTK